MPLGVPASPSLKAVRELIAEADQVLAVGTEFGPTEYDMYGLWRAARYAGNDPRGCLRRTIGAAAGGEWRCTAMRAR